MSQIKVSITSNILEPPTYTEDDDELEEGTFEDYEFGNGDLPSDSKVFTKPIIESDEQKAEYDAKPELTGTEKYYKSPLPEKQHVQKPQSPEKAAKKPDSHSEDLNILPKVPVQSKSKLSSKIDKEFNPFINNSLSKVEGWTTSANQGTLVEFIE